MFLYFSFSSSAEVLFWRSDWLGRGMLKYSNGVVLELIGVVDIVDVVDDEADFVLASVDDDDDDDDDDGVLFFTSS